MNCQLPPRVLQHFIKPCGGSANTLRSTYIVQHPSLSITVNRRLVHWQNPMAPPTTQCGEVGRMHARWVAAVHEGSARGTWPHTAGQVDTPSRAPPHDHHSCRCSSVQRGPAPTPPRREAHHRARIMVSAVQPPLPAPPPRFAQLPTAATRPSSTGARSAGSLRSVAAAPLRTPLDRHSHNTSWWGGCATTAAAAA